MIDESLKKSKERYSMTYEDLVDAKTKKLSRQSKNLALELEDTSEGDLAKTSDSTLTQIQAFMLNQAKAELMRVIKLTDTLNQLEDTYMDRALNDANGMDMKSLAMTMDVITRCLNRSMELIRSVTDDKNLSILIDQSTTNIMDQSTNTVNILDNKESRDKMRNIAAQMLSAVKAATESRSKPSNIVDTEIVDSEEGDN